MRRLACLLVLTACVDSPATQTQAPAPLVGVDGSHDQADRNCNVVLRDLQPDHGPQTTYSGRVDISQVAATEGLVPSLMYKDPSHGTWSAVTGVPSSQPGTPGYVRYDVHIPTVQNAPFQVVPYLQLAQGGRLFDHNRNPSDLDNYTVQGPDYAIWQNPSVCQPPDGPTQANLVFDADFTQHRDGILAPGGTVSIIYAQSRLNGCRQTQNGYQLWDITAHVLFQPGGQLLGASVRDQPATFTVPIDARQAIVWFESNNATGCHLWDSNFGANYTFDALTPPQWVGNADVLMTRDTSGDICGGGDIRNGFSFDTWTRQRAALTNMCFEVYQPGMTDHDDPQLWQKLDTELHWRYAGQTRWTTTPVSFDRRTGNNARYAFGLRSIDPFRDYHCPEVAATPTPDNQYVQIPWEYYIVVNGYELRPEPGAAYGGTFIDYPSNPWRQANCH
ncbi:MAG: hypothetical protein JO257_37195 [Deltaproteobacteria bacterium]|nr:hypothetical protein [Deltaproteobacteria bacterium]